jgi:tetratricopeptide (TPR) repeat protein
MMSHFFKNEAFPRVVVLGCILLLFSPNCRQTSLVRSPSPTARNGYRPASPGSLSSYIRTVLRISAEKGPRVEQALKHAQEQNPRLVSEAKESSDHPGDLQAGLRVAESYMNAGLYYPAFEVYQRLEATGEPDVKIELGLAAIWDQWQDYSLAQDHAEAALRLDPQSHEGWSRLGRIHLHHSDFAAAASSFEKAIALDPSDPVLFANAGYAFLRLDRVEKAEACLEKALSMDGTIVEAHNHLGIVLARLGRYELALTHFTQTSEPAVALNNLGIVLLEQGKQDEARKYFQQAIALKPDYQRARAHLDEVDSPAVPSSPITPDSPSKTSLTVAPGALPVVAPPALEPVAHPDRVSVSITPTVAPKMSSVRPTVPDSESLDTRNLIETGDIVIGKEAYRVKKTGSETEPSAPVTRAAVVYQPALPAPLRSVAALAQRAMMPSLGQTPAPGAFETVLHKELLAQAIRPGTGQAGPLGPSRSGANLQVTALGWQDPLLNPAVLADISLGRSTSPHSGRPDRPYVPSGLNLLLSGLFAFAVVIGLLLAGSYRVVVGFSLIVAGVVAGLMAL